MLGAQFQNDCATRIDVMGEWDTKMLDRYLIDVDLMVFAVYVLTLITL